MNEETKDTMESGAVHLIAAMIATTFFRWQKTKGSFWEAGDEALIASGIGAVFDIGYWLFKPRILKWRRG